MIRTYRPNDPLYGQQWHFDQIGKLGFDGPANRQGIERIWADYRGDGLNVGIWDTGVQRTHWDLDANYNAGLHLTGSGGRINDGQPALGRGGDSHGTAVAGLIAAENNGNGGVGIAFDASVTGIRFLNTIAGDDTSAIFSGLRNFDITNHSWGSSVAGPYWVHTVAHWQNSVETGRTGLGTINLKAAGNSNVNSNGELNNATRFTITVAATDSQGKAMGYSNYGADILVSAPAGSVTADVLGGFGYSTGDYTTGFGGTSAATPVTAGVVSLMLSANPQLGWRDVQNILAYSATGTGSYTGIATWTENSAWKWNGADNWNGGGLHFSEDYGYGLVNAFNAVRMAEVWRIVSPTAQTSANERSVTTGNLTVNAALVDRGTWSYSFNVSGNLQLEHVALTLSLQHMRYSDLRIDLVSPEGTTMMLHDGSGNGNATSNLTWTFGVDGLRGEMSAGTWTVKITDGVAGSTGRVNSVNLTAYGTTPTPDDVYHYTDEAFFAMAKAGQAGRVNLADTDGGADWINAAAMVRDLVLDLKAGASSTMAGRDFIRIASGTVIEHAVAGDGNDVLRGNDADNVLYGMRGDDQLDGGAGVDTAGFRGRRAEYEVSTQNGVTTVRSLDGKWGTDILRNIEKLRFDDVVIDDPNAGPPPPPPAPDSRAPMLLGLTPADDATGVALDANLVIRFDEAVKADSGFITIYNANGTVRERITVSDAARVSFSGSSVVVNPAIDFAAGSAHHVIVDAGALTDLAGNVFAGLNTSTAFNFTTVAAPSAGPGTPNEIRGTSGADNLNGTANNDTILGLGGNDRLTGQGGNDLLDGGAGNDTMDGGSGDDSFIVDTASDRVIEAANAGTDTVRTSLSNHMLAQNVENLVYTGNAAFFGTGNAQANELIGGAGNDYLQGLAGSDVLRGNAGNDSIAGGTGKDDLWGGAGADRFIFSTAADAGNGAEMDAIRDFVTGSDRIDLSMIDANAAITGNQSFSAALVTGFTGLAGQLMTGRSGSDLIVSGDLNGDRVADFQIRLSDVSAVTAGDFIL